MPADDYLPGIRNLNLSYLMIAQQMIREDRAEALFRLGLSGEIADLIGGPSNVQALKMAACDSSLGRFRFPDPSVLGSFLSDRTVDEAGLHAPIVWAPQTPESIA